jgi:hypothetical protein
MSLPDVCHESRNFKKLGNEAGISMKAKVGGMSYVVCGRSGKENRGCGLGDGVSPLVGACQHHSLDLSCGSRKPINLEKEFFFDGTKRECI